jgi:hypothetical protein
MFSQTAGGGAYWRWNFDFQNGPPDFEAHGHCDSLEDAKAAVGAFGRCGLMQQDSMKCDLKGNVLVGL